MVRVHVILFLHTFLKGNGNTLLTNLFQGKWYSFSCTHFSSFAHYLSISHLFQGKWRYISCTLISKGNGDTILAHFQGKLISKEW